MQNLNGMLDTPRNPGERLAVAAAVTDMPAQSVFPENSFNALPAGRNGRPGRPVADLTIGQSAVPEYNKKMGIRFYCPNGHKLNVKAFLAGKRGICPHCGAKVQIPTESTLDPGKKGGHGKNGVAIRSRETERLASSTRSDLATPNDIERASSYAVTESPSPGGQDSPASGAGTPPKLPQAKPLPDDLLDEDPDAVWYVRVADGAQYGPAGAEEMRQWMEEGRIGDDSLVWREGWKDWRKAFDAFPSLRDGSIPKINTGGMLPGRSEPGGVAGAGVYARSARSRSTTSRAVVITTLVLGVIVGAAVLAWIVLK